MPAISDEMTTKFLTAAVTALRHNVVPALSTPEARINADLVSRILYMLHARFSTRSDDLQRLHEGDQQLLADIEALVGPGKQTPLPAHPAPFSHIEEMEHKVYDSELAVNQQLPALMEQCRVGGEPRDRAVQVLTKLVSLQKTFLAAQDPDILKGSFVCYQGGRIDEEREIPLPTRQGMKLNGDNLERYLQHRFPGSKVEDFSTMAGGFSKSTLFFTLVHQEGGRERLVIRKDPATPHVSPIAMEFPLLKQLYAIGFPVARPRWLEQDTALFDGGFMVSDRVSGTTDITRWAGDARAVESFARQLARVMADLHRITLEELGFDREVAGLSAGELTTREIDHWRKQLYHTRLEAKPLCEMALAWLDANIPASAYQRRGCLVHGDIGFHNLMVDDGEVNALLDWEFCHPGDPIEDLLYVKPFIEKVMEWGTFKNYYYEYGGPQCTAEEEFFYTIWSKTRNPVSAVPAAKVFVDSFYDSVPYAGAGFILARYLELEAAEAILENLAG
jgi:aminoglycoside phosphotransferase (APT) family kinase protein